ncbi:response regulator [Sphingobium algorifonticola]|uniref:Response regulator n=1 Tax=Sphingobium algorifonticola TaxID=2008318 RepID=A0A437JCY2_9SPHN|nr:response regulator [Sphingobium algorifonticola]RVT43724.1 response regulator [Sphingobium algorifonticola]
MAQRVLIVEDEIFVALEIEDIVTSAGFAVSAIAADRAAALSAAPESDIALVDLNLRDGPTGPLIGQTLARDFGIKVIYVTANPSQIGPAAEAALGVITKPFRSATIETALAIVSAANDDLAIDLSAVSGFIPFRQGPGASRGSESAG